MLFFALMALLMPVRSPDQRAFRCNPAGSTSLRGLSAADRCAWLGVPARRLLARPASARVIAPGVLLIVAGGVGLAVTLNLLPASLLDFAAPLLPVVLVIVAVLRCCR